MEFNLLCLLLVGLIIYFTFTKISEDKKYHSGYNKGWDDCLKTYENFEMSPDDKLVLYIMKKAIKSYLRNRSYIDQEALEEIDNVDNFRDFKHIVHYLAIYKKENTERE